MIYRILLLFALSVFPLLSSAQKRVVVTDPEIKFSYILPEGWMVEDDGYDYKITAKNIANANIVLTYLEGAQGTGNFESIGSKQSFEQDYLFEIQYILPEEFSNFKVQENGTTKIDETPARWVKFSYGPNADKTGIFYMYQKLNQTFKITGSVPAAQFEKVEPIFKAIVDSFQAEKR
ncbi:hypothetical protein SAMN04489724_3857 [Algoriphagus locisalis]|uniref:Uncharacterized protein n=1 Tax=Algoriphagus locisalis TaxID=305507 RepID=A0A1I7DBB1_9BACT|nr:hypothetical protein [Algoriphagus locisalis]SFU08937.1 hypothetical protein SAMN04489724_3857 [Algoriphagus locisalis]